MKIAFDRNLVCRKILFSEISSDLLAFILKKKDKIQNYACIPKRELAKKREDEKLSNPCSAYVRHTTRKMIKELELPLYQTH